ncbi:MAG TPA: hypothetical protein VJ302_23020 [Blastocatellia bacterium]|nr:hypothetical protein [Blastocatellia bacterium]
MPNKSLLLTLLIVCSMWMLQPGWSATGMSIGGRQSAAAKYTGLWSGSYKTENGGSGDLAFNLSQDEKGQWRGQVKFTNNDGPQQADFKTLQIADGKMKGKMESPDGQVEVTIEGQFEGEKLEGSYAVIPKGSTEVIEKGTWKTSKSAAAK